MTVYRVCLWLCMCLACLCFEPFPIAMAYEQEAFWKSPRAMGRGGAYTAAFDSDEGAFLNPATLAEAPLTYQLRFYQGDLFVGEHTVDTISTLTTLLSASDAITGVMQTLETQYGQKQSFRSQMVPLAQRIKAFEVAPFSVTSASLLLEAPALPKMSWQGDAVMGVSVAYALALGPQTHVGLALRPMQRIYTSGDIQLVDLIDFIPPSKAQLQDYSPLRKATMIAADLGAHWTPSPSFRLGFVWHNMGHTSALSKTTATPPPPIKQRISFGMLHRVPVGRWFHLDTMADVQDLWNPLGLNWLRLLHGGIELGASPFSRDHDWGVLWGLNEGYMTQGIFADAWFLRLDVVRYSVETGVTPGQLPDGQIAVSLRSTMTF